ncbi:MULTISPECIES: VOC family protein [unclassified Knoellia]|uniref:VOC family protein n=1 Tax=Knoellia altitudinis TaxID=3404795 RepID=UPI003616026A
MLEVRWMWMLLDTVEADAGRSEAFWQRVTRSDLSDREGDDDEFVTLRPRRGDAWVALQRVVEGGGVHLDLAVDQPLTQASADAVSLGATEVSRTDGLVVLRSPGGLPFCLLSWRDCGSPDTQVREGEPDLLDQVCIDIPSEGYSREVDFWETLTGWPKRPGSLREFVSLTRPDGIPVRLLFQRLGEPSGRVRGHVDFACVDRAVSREVHLAAGASVVSEHDFWTVMRDPVGRTYCLTHRLP